MANPLTQKQLKLITDKMNRSDRRELVDLFIKSATQKLNHRLLDARNRSSILWAISCHLAKTTSCISSVLIYRIYLLSEYSVEVVNQYIMRGNQCYRHRITRDKPRTRNTTRRRSSIYGWSGEVMPRTYLDKLSTPIKTQRDYDRMMEKTMGYDQTEYRRRNKIGIYT